MKIIYSDNVAALFEKANSYGLSLTVFNGKLLIKGLKGKKVDELFLEKLRAKKWELLPYLQNNEDADFTTRLYERTDRLELGELLYYKIDPFHPSYWWLDKSKDVEFKKSLFNVSAYSVTGIFDVEACREAVRYLINRHEVLRTTFHQFDGALYMHVGSADNTRFNLEYADLRSVKDGRDQLADNLLNFADNEFDLFVGPLFLVRLVHITEHEYILSITIHHSIYDGWSMEVLSKDFMAAYDAICRGGNPGLQKLKLQYKDYMYLNSCYQQQNFESHKMFWRKQLTEFPGEMALPGEKRPLINSQECGIEIAVITSAMKNRLNNLGNRYHASIFIILQAVFSCFVKELTGQNEIIWGTIGFNRDGGADIEQQIGSYAKFYLLRVVLSDRAAFPDVLDKIKQANDDALHYRAYSLLNALEDTLPPDKALNGCAWKFNLYYEEQIGYGLNVPETNSLPEELSVNSIPVSPKRQLLNISIELKFINHDDKIDLVVAYQKDIYDAPVIKKLINGFIQHLKIIAYS
jgi:hypothetical protein